jgi:SAM-dependent methyltransferase
VSPAHKDREPPVATGAGADYILGHSERELRRLEAQAAYFRDLTEDLLRRAGIGRGMSVLDLGCGAGDVSLLASDLVGPSGAVLGIDRSPEAIAMARRRAQTGGLARLRFEVADIDGFAGEERFDAVIGRLVLLYQADPVATLRRAAAHLRPNGILAFQEMCMPMMRCVPESPLFRQCLSWITATFSRAGFEIDMGARLAPTFLAAGLPRPALILGGKAGGGPGAPEYPFIAGVLRSLLPAAERLGVARPEEVEIDTLAERLEREAVALDATVIAPPLLGAWTRVAG